MRDFDVLIDGIRYPLVRDVTHPHPREVHAHLGTTSEVGLQRLLDAVTEDKWFSEDGTYVGRDVFGIGIVGED